MKARIVIVGQGPNQACWKHGLAFGVSSINQNIRNAGLTPDPAAVLEAAKRHAENYAKRVANTGTIGRKLATLAGYNVAARGDLLFYRDHERRNLNARWNGKKGRGDIFDREEAAWKAQAILEEKFDKHVLLGAEVARAFGFKEKWTPLALGSVDFSTGLDFLLFPHPSGLSTWWNNPDNAERARVALRSFLNR